MSDLVFVRMKSDPNVCAVWNKDDPANETHRQFWNFYKTFSRVILSFDTSNSPSLVLLSRTNLKLTDLHLQMTKKVVHNTDSVSSETLGLPVVLAQKQLSSDDRGLSIVISNNKAYFSLLNRHSERIVFNEKGGRLDSNVLVRATCVLHVKKK